MPTASSSSGEQLPWTECFCPPQIHRLEVLSPDVLRERACGRESGLDEAMKVESL